MTQADNQPYVNPIAEYVAALEKLLKASLELCNHIGTGWEAAPQSMSVTMAQQAVREFRKAAVHARKLQIDGSDNAEGDNYQIAHNDGSDG